MNGLSNKYQVLGTRTFQAMLIVLVALTSTPSANATTSSPGILNTGSLSSKYFGNDAAWYLANIPFFDCSDPQIQQIYYYRWKLYKAHIRDLGSRGYIITEFLNNVGWAKFPYNSLN